jgi:3-hydroxy-9,10-secoandrosta-1,3,5(10)-triene-9,17-dione monooxygenase reductase component
MLDEAWDIAPQDFRRVLSLWPTGVTVVTAQHEGRPAGMVANSFTSVSLAPPLVSWCVARTSLNLDVWLQAAGFAVHILAIGQSALVSRFSRTGTDKFDRLEWTEGASGAPLLPDCVARLECRTWQKYDGGDHVILVGRVIAVEDSDRHAMSFHRGQLGPAPLGSLISAESPRPR